MNARLFVFPLLLAVSGSAETLVDGRRSIVLENEQALVVVDLLGGSIVEFRHKGLDLNPLRWRNDGPADEARSMSHFLCLDRWGQPSEAERANGMPGHGEAAKVEWSVLAEPAARGEWVEARMSARLPMAGLEVERTIRLAREGAWLQVEESVTNRNPLGRVYNMVQHPTIGPPFLDETVLVDSNAGKGFPQNVGVEDIDEAAREWPRAAKGRTDDDLRRLADDADPNVVSYVVDEPVGWTTAANPGRRLLIGYRWKTADYPWLNLWRHVEDGKPLARGLEFGTTGLHQPFPVLIEQGRIFGRPILDFLDAGETHTRSYEAFLAEVPSDFQGVGRLADDILSEQGGGRKIKIR